MLEENSETLRKLYKTRKDAKEKIHYLALYNISWNKTVTEIAEMLDIDRPMVYDWIEKWANRRSIQDKPKSGGLPQLSEDDKSKIKDLVDENDPKKQGINANLWSCHNLQISFMLK